MNPIHLLALGDVHLEVLEDLLPDVMRTFAVPATAGALKLDLEQFYDTARAQYNSTNLLLSLKENQVQQVNAKVVAVLDVDLFIPILTYVFGEAEVGGRVAVVSSYRLQNERYGLPPDKALLRGRLLKEVIHELGHVYSLTHCLDPACVMHASSYVEEIDLKGQEFCVHCSTVVGGHTVQQTHKAGRGS